MIDIGAIIGDSRVGGLLSAIGIALAIASYFWRREKILVRYAAMETSIAATRKQTRFTDDLEIYFKGTAVPTVTSTYFWIWNAGNTLIRSDDIAAADRLRLILPDGSTILQCAINKSSRPVNNVRYSHIDGSPTPEVVLEFDFLDRMFVGRKWPAPAVS